MKLLLAGVNHRSAPVEARERLAFRSEEMADALRRLCRESGILEGMILSTCNRVEVLTAAEDSADPQLLPSFLAAVREVDAGWLEPFVYRYEDSEAIRHLFRVAASLDSMVVGEPQILGQLKAAFQVAKDQGTVAGVLQELLTRAFNVAKRVRAETAIGKSAVSVSYAAVELAREIFGSLQGSSVMLIGAGKMSELAARHLRRSGASRVSVANRTKERADEMAALFGGTVVPYERLLQTLPEMDIVISSSGAPEYVLRKADMKRVIEARKNRPMFLVDIAVPRNIEPTVNDLDNVFLYDIDDLQRVVETNIEGRQREADEAERIVASEVERTVERLRSRRVAPTIVSLQDQLEQIRAAEFLRIRGKLGALTAQQEEAIVAMTRAIVNKIAHGPISELRREAGSEGGVQVAGLIRRIFRLGE